MSANCCNTVVPRATAGVLAGLVGLALCASTASAFTVKQVRMHSDGKRLTYSLIICTPHRATLTLAGTMTATGQRTARPGATQYQDKGCYPAAVSVPVVARQGSCVAAGCGAVRGHLYRGRVVVTDSRTKRSSVTARRQARA